MATRPLAIDDTHRILFDVPGDGADSDDETVHGDGDLDLDYSSTIGHGLDDSDESEMKDVRDELPATSSGRGRSARRGGSRKRGRGVSRSGRGR